MRRRWLGGLLAVVLGGGAAVAVVISPAVRAALADAGDVVAGWSTRLRDMAATIPQTEVEERSLGGASSSLLIVVGTPEAAAFALLATGPGAPPSLTVLPQELLVAVPGFGEYSLADALEFEGAELATLAVTNEFGLRIDHTVVVPPAAFAAAIAGPVTVDLAAPFFTIEGGQVVRRLPVGESQVEPAVLTDVLTTPGATDAFEWIQRQGAAWAVVLAEVAADPGTADRLLADDVAAADLLVTVAGAADLVIGSVPSEVTDPAGGTLVPADNAEEFLASRLGHLLLRPEGRPRFEVLNGNGRIGATRAVAAVLIRAGFRLVRTDNADRFDYADTLVIAQGEAAAPYAREVVGLLGHGLVFLEVRAPSRVVDLSIIVGTDVPTGEG